MKYIPALTVSFIALAGVVIVPLFGSAAVAGQDWRQPQQTTSSPYMVSEAWAVYESVQSALQSSSPTTLATAGRSQSNVGVLDNDVDNNSNRDDMTIPLAVLSLVLAVLSMVFILRALAGERLLLALCAPSKLFSVWFLVPERPG
jgi:hypothetical protein